MSDQPIRDLMASMSRELGRLASLAGAIDAAVGRLPLSQVDGVTLDALQQVDLLRQSLECLGQYSDALAELVDGSARVDPRQAAAALPLRDLAQALTGQDARTTLALRDDGHETCFF